MPHPSANRSAFSLSLSPGTVLANQYRIESQLGEPGGFGIVYLARDLRLEIPVAIKEFLPRDLAGRGTDQVTVHPHSGSDADLFHFGLQQFLREAQILARLDHPGIVRVRNFFEEFGTAYLVMDFYEGVSLAAHLSAQPDGRLAPELAVEVMLRVLDGLEAAHRQDILHRDIKPANIYLTREGRPILLDFGAARQAVGQRSRSMTTVLTPGYAPVEQYGSQGKNQGPWTDVYASAATLYRMITGVEPIDAPERMVDSDPMPPPSRYMPRISAALDRAIMRGLALDFRERPQSVEEFIALLCGPAVQGPTSTTSKTSRTPRASKTTSTSTGSGTTGDPPSRAFPPRRESRKTTPAAESALKPGLIAGVALAVLVLAGSGVAIVNTLSSGEQPPAAAEPTIEPLTAPSADASPPTQAPPEPVRATPTVATRPAPVTPVKVDDRVEEPAPPKPKPQPAPAPAADPPEGDLASVRSLLAAGNAAMNRASYAEASRSFGAARDRIAELKNGFPRSRSLNSLQGEVDAQMRKNRTACEYTNELAQARNEPLIPCS